MPLMKYLIFLGIFLLFTFPAYSYIDPNAGNMLLQLIGGGLAVVLLAVKVFWHRILAFFGLRKEQEPPNISSH